MKRVRDSITILFSMLLLGGCATPVVEQERSGFISDYSQLQPTSKTSYDAVSDQLASYTRFIIDTPELVLDDESAADAEFTEEELSELVVYAAERTAKVLNDSGRYQVVTQPDSGVARIRLGITALDPSIGALNVFLYTKITGAGLGGAALESEIVDSQSGDQLAASIQWGNGSRVLRAGLTRLGDAKLQINRWARNLLKQLDEAHASDSDN